MEINNITIARLRGTFIKYYEIYLDRQYQRYGITLENNKGLKLFEEKIKKIYNIDNEDFIKLIINLHPMNNDFMGDQNIDTSGLINIYFPMIHRFNKDVFNNICFNINNKKYIITTITRTNDIFIVLDLIENSNLDSNIYMKNKEINIVNYYVNGNGFELIKSLPKFKNFNFENNDYKNGENGLYLNPKKINFINIERLLIEESKYFSFSN